MSRVIGGGRKDYEKVAVDEWLSGIIDEIQYDAEHEYQVKDQETGEWHKQTAAHVRFKFKLDGYEYAHYSRWMRASTHKKSNLYRKYLHYLCPKYDCEDKMIDLDRLQGAAVRVMYENDGDYQNVTQIRGVDEDLNIIASGVEAVEPTDVESTPPPPGLADDTSAHIQPKDNAIPEEECPF